MASREGAQVQGLFRRAGFALVPVLVLVLSLELVARTIYRPPVYAPGGPLGWTVQPNLQELVVEVEAPRESFVVSTNADGLRSSYARPRPSGTQRLVTLGDSTIFGWGVPPTEAPAAILEQLLTERRGGDWQVVNAGQPGYSSEQMRRLADALLPAWSPDGVVWFHPWHDVVSAPSDRSLLPPESRRLRRPRSVLAQWLQDRRRYSGPSNNPLFPLPYHSWSPLSVRVSSVQRADNLQRLVAAAEAVGAWVMIVLLPNNRTLFDPDRAPLARELESVSRSLGVVYLDLSQEPAEPRLEALTIPGDDGHFNAAANRLYVEHVLAVMPTRTGRSRE